MVLPDTRSSQEHSRASSTGPSFLEPKAHKDHKDHKETFSFFFFFLSEVRFVILFTLLTWTEYWFVNMLPQQEI